MRCPRYHSGIRCDLLPRRSAAVLRRAIEVFDDEETAESPGPLAGSEVALAENAVSASVPERLEAAKHLLSEIERGQAPPAPVDRQRRLVQTWQLGRALAAMKEEVGHGQWLNFLATRWPQLSNQNAGRYLSFHQANPNSGSSGNLRFSPESIRRLRWNYVPAKERPSGTSLAHHGFVAAFHRWERRLAIGRPGSEAAPVEILREDCGPVLQRLAELLGREFVHGLLEEPCVGEQVNL